MTTCPHCAHELTPREILALYRSRKRDPQGGRPRTAVPRCGCAEMTLARARKRGKSAAEHLPGCEWYPAASELAKAR